MTAHARVGPSSIARVIRCPGSVRESAGLPNTSSVFAAEGSVLHEIAAECLEFGFEPDRYLGRTMSHDGFSFKIGTAQGETDPGCMGPALDWLREQPGELFVETRVELDPWMPGQFGTCDVCIWDADTKTATVFDWKFGMGVMVDTEGNEQLQTYALGALHTILRPRGLAPEKVVIIIEQPRGQGGQRYYEPWEITYDELLAFGDVLIATWKTLNEPNAPLCAGEKQCFFCSVKKRPPQKSGDLTGCSTYDAFNMSIIDTLLDDVDEAIELGTGPELPRNVTGERRWWIVRHAKMFEKWLATLHEDCTAAAVAGVPDPGSKLVAGRRGDRNWSEDDIDMMIVEHTLKKSLFDNAFTRKLKSPAQAEKDLASKRGRTQHPGVWDAMSDLIVRGDGKPILVGLDDPRPALESVDDKFDDEP